MIYVLEFVQFVLQPQHYAEVDQQQLAAAHYQPTAEHVMPREIHLILLGRQYTTQYSALGSKRCLRQDIT